MLLDRAFTIRTAVVVLGLILTVGFLVSRPTGPVLMEADFSLDHITPNADRTTDATRISYRIRRDALLSIYFEGEDGQRYIFRQDELRTRGSYEVLFSGIVEPYLAEGETVNGTILQRLMPDGEYTWVIEAADQSTERVDRVTGPLMVTDGDPILPDLYDFSVSPPVFTPNQDGISDRVTINVYVPKPAHLQVSLIDQDGRRVYIPEKQEVREPGSDGLHTFDYDGGVDNGGEPPPDGTYTVLVEAADDEGQKVERRSQLTIQHGGVPRAEVVAQPVGDTVQFSSETLRLGDVLMFRLTVRNYGETPIRTTGPEPGYIYDQDDLFTSSGYYVESGAWRVGIHCDTCLTDYPWRWALGAQDSLTPIEADGRVHYYLMPGDISVITGGIRLLNIVPSRNPQYFWAGLIHEDVNIYNDRVDPHFITIMPEVLLGGF